MKSLTGIARPPGQGGARAALCRQMRALAVLSFTVVFAPGCGTVVSQFKFWALSERESKPEPTVYGGLIFDAYHATREINLVSSGILSYETGDPPFRVFPIITLLFWFPDMCLCLGADTALLPLTTGQSIYVALLPEDKRHRRYWLQERITPWQWATGPPAAPRGTFDVLRKLGEFTLEDVKEISRDDVSHMLDERRFSHGFSRATHDDVYSYTIGCIEYIQDYAPDEHAAEREVARELLIELGRRE